MKGIMKKVLVCVLLGILIPVFAFGSEIQGSDLALQGDEGVEKKPAPEKKGSSLKQGAKVGLAILALGLSLVGPVIELNFLKSPVKDAAALGHLGFQIYKDIDNKRGLKKRAWVENNERNEVENVHQTGF